MTTTNLSSVDSGSIAFQATDSEDLASSVCEMEATERESPKVSGRLERDEPFVVSGRLEAEEEEDSGVHPIQTFLAGEDGTESGDPIIDQEGNRAKMETAFKNVKKAFLKEGKKLLILWPKSLKADWEDLNTGERGTSYLNSSDSDIQDLRRIYGAYKEDGEKGKKYHDISKWPSMANGVRGDLNGPLPLQKTTERLKSRFSQFTPEHLEHGLKKATTPAQKIEILRKTGLADAFDKFFYPLMLRRKRWHEAQLAALSKKETLDAILPRFPELTESDRDRLTQLSKEPSDPAREAVLTTTIEHFDRFSDPVNLNRFAVNWALSHPITGSRNATDVANSFKENVEELQTVISKENGDILPVNPISHLVPGSAFINKKVNHYWERRSPEPKPSETEFSEDVTALGIVYPDDIDRERYNYRSTCKKVKQDSLEQILVKLVKAIDAYQENPGEGFVSHPFFDGLVGRLPPGEQVFLKNQIRDFADQHRQIANELKTVEGIDKDTTPQACIQAVNLKWAEVQRKLFPKTVS